MTKKFFVWLLFLGVFSLNSGWAQESKMQSSEGMWLPLKVKELNYEDMVKKGIELPAEKIYNESEASLEDAIVKLNGGQCTSEMISGEGLMLTNHHCAYDAIATLSTEDNDLLTNGFWAMSRGEELPIPGSTAALLIRSEDVSAKVLAAGDQMEQTIEEIVAKATEGTNYVAEVEEMFHGAEYYLFVYEVFRDVRLVGAPPSSIGKFGYDTDNWVWPRHTGDFSLLRVYAGPDNKPADYSPDNKPYNPRHFLPISLQGVSEEDYAMVMGYPGSTTRYLTASAIRLALEQSNLDKIELMGQKARIMKSYMDRDDKTRIAMAADYASLMNTYKYYIGQTTMMGRYDVPGQKAKQEVEFQKWAESDPVRKEKYGTVLKDIDELHGLYKPAEHFMNYLYYSTLAPSASVFSYLEFSGLYGALQSDDKEATAEAVAEVKEAMENHFKTFFYEADRDVFAASFISFYNNMSPELRPKIFDEILNPEAEQTEEATGKKKKKKKKNTEMEVLPSIEPVNMDERITAWTANAYQTSLATDKERLNAFLQNPDAETIAKDPIFRYVAGVIDFYRQRVGLAHATFNYQIEGLWKTYVEGLREMHTDKKFYPDANSTMRLTYGKVRAYEPRDGVSYHYYTTLDGVIEKEDPNNEEFIVPEKLKDLYQKKDYGRYGKDGVMPLCFITTNDITGGNSGSPVINSKGHLIGAAFDGNWEAMSGDIHVFPNLNRTICVDARYILFIIDKYAGAGHLLKEMTIVE
ncbi:MAG: S46 family peptidase [Bacteroidia bacterium]|nr:S46 family peptidase [Bacteroidia bacterium]